EIEIGDFYTALTSDADYQTIINHYIPQTDISAASAKFTTVLELHESYIIARGNSQSCTVNHKKALTALRKWMKAYYAIASVAFSESPQEMEKLGRKR
ncbi:MAG: hypothetical protein KDD94_12875, partial [Calditrichaeota bacterium]|nr:hypothetical protein [Calditrichota bacterium]